MMTIEISPGEAFDRLSILRLKADRIENREKKKNVLLELEVVSAICDPIDLDDHAWRMLESLDHVNTALWDVEDELRLHERRGDFNESFVALARSVYHLNDERAKIKRAINMSLESPLIEEKSYASYAMPSASSRGSGGGQPQGSLHA
jgi:hypothetical protein